MPDEAWTSERVALAEATLGQGRDSDCNRCPIRRSLAICGARQDFSLAIVCCQGGQPTAKQKNAVV